MSEDRLIRVGETILNLDNVLMVDLNWRDDEEPDDEAAVVVEFSMRGMDELDDGHNIAQPYLKCFFGAEAEAIRRHLKKRCPDLLTNE